MWLGFAAVYVALLPFERLWDKWLGSATMFKPYRLVGMALLVVFVLRSLAARAPLMLDRYDRALIALFVWGLAMTGLWYVVNDADPASTLNEGTLILFALSTYLVLKNTISQRDHVAVILNVYVAAFVVAIGVTLVLVPDAFAARFSGLYKNPNQAGFAAALGVLLLIGRFYFEARVSSLRRLAYAAGAIGFAAILALSGSRGSLIGGAAAVLTFFVAMRRSSTVAVTRIQRLLIVGVALLALGLAGPRAWSAMSEESSALDRYSPETAGGFSGRVDIWRSALAVAADHFLLGAGIAQYMNYHQEYAARLSHLYDPRVLEHRLNTHSDLLGLLANYGLIGLTLYLSVVVRLLREIGRAVRYGAAEHYIYPVLMATEVLVLGSSLFRDSFASPEFFFVLALIMIASRRAALGPAVTRRGGAGVPVRPSRLAA